MTMATDLELRACAVSTLLRDQQLLARLWPTAMAFAPARNLAVLQAAELVQLERQLDLHGGPGPAEGAGYWLRRQHVATAKRRRDLLAGLPAPWPRLLGASDGLVRQGLQHLGVLLLAGLADAGGPTRLLTLGAELPETATVALLAARRNAAALAVVRPLADATEQALATIRRAGEPASRWSYLLGRRALAAAFHQLSDDRRAAMLTASRMHLTASSLPELLAGLQPLAGEAKAEALAQFAPHAVVEGLVTDGAA